MRSDTVSGADPHAVSGAGSAPPASDMVSAPSGAPSGAPSAIPSPAPPAGGPVPTAAAAPLIHVGLHKTGSTWLQRRVFAARNGAGIAYSGDAGLIHGQFIMPGTEDYDPATPRATFAPLLAEAARTGGLAVLSDEGLGGRPFHGTFLREVHAARLAAAFPDARILVTIREQRRIVYSMYGQYLRFGYASRLDEFLARPPEGSVHHPVLDRGYYDYARMIAGYERHFPAENILVVPMEWMLEDPDAVLGLVSARTGVDLAPMPPSEARRVENPALSDLAYGVLRRANRFVAQDSRWQRQGARFGPNAIAWQVDRLTPGSLRRSMRKARMARIDAALGETYAASNAAVAARTGLDLARWGYRVAP